MPTVSGETFAFPLAYSIHALACTAGAVWMFTPQGHLQLQFQINMRQIGIDASDSHRERHAELLRLVVTKGQPLIMAPHSGEKPWFGR